MADGGDGFEGRIAVVQRTRGYRKWPEEVKARIVAESFRAGVRVVDVARRHGVIAHQLSDWRRQARQGLLAAGCWLYPRMPQRGWRPPSCRWR